MTNPLLQIGSEIDQELVSRKRTPSASPQADTGGGAAPTQSGSSPTPQGYNRNGGLSEEFGAAMRGGLDMVTFGTLDEISGTLATLLPGDLGLPGQHSYWGGTKSFGDALASNIAVERAVQKADSESYWKSRTAGQVVGAIVVPVGAEAKGAAGFAKVGAAQGAAYGFGSGEGAGRVTGAIEGGVAGGIVGGVLGKLGEVIAPRVKALFGRAPVEEAAPLATEEASKLTPEGLILGTTKEGTPILGGVTRDAEGAAQKPLTDLLPARVETVEGQTIEAGTQVATAADKASQGSQGAAMGQRESLAALQGVVKDLSAEQRAIGDKAVDVTWETSPDVAARTGEWRIGSLQAPEDAQSLLRAIVEGTTSKVTRSDADLEKAAYDAANRIGEDPEAVLAYASQIAGKVGDVDTAVATLRTLWSKVSQDVSDFHLMNVDWSTAADDLVNEAAQRIYNLSAISGEFQKVKTGLGRGLRVMQLPTAKAYLEGVAKAGAEGVDAAAPSREMIPLPRTRQELSDWFDLWGATGGDPARQSAMLQGLLTLPTGGKYLRQSFANFFTASILSAPRTVGLNVIGPGVISLVRNVERMAGAATLSINPFVTQAERQGARAVATHSAKAYIQTFTEIGDAFRQALVAAERNHTLIGGGGQTLDVVATYGPLTDNLLRAAGGQPSTAYTLGNLINVFPRAFARLNNGLDEFSKRLAYQGEVRVNAMVEAAQQGLEGAEFTSFVSKAMREAYDAAGHASDEALLRSAERTTLTSQVGEAGGMIRKAANGIQRLRAAVPEVRYLLPVFNVPANALGETLRRLPIAAIPGVNKVVFSQTARELAGELGPVAQADAHGRMLLGSAFLLGGYMMNKSGTLTGAGPQDPTDRKVWLQTHQPYSIKVGDQWVRYDKFDILGGLLSIPATIYDATTYHDDTRDPQEIMFAGVGALAQWFKDRAALRNAAGLFALGDDPTKNTENVFTQMTGNIASGFYPAALRTTITDGMTNPYVPMKRAWTDYIAAALPGNNVEMVRNVLGEPVEKSLNSVPEAFLPVSTVKATGWDTDPVMDELDRLYQATGYGAGADTTSFSYGQFPDKDLKLEDGQSLYTHAMRARQEIEVDGKTLRQTLTDLFNSDEYNQAVDGRRSGRATSRGDINRPYLVGEVFEKFNKAIKARLVEESPKARDYMTAALAKSTDAAYLRDVSVEDLVNNPNLYRTKGVDREAFQGRLTSGGGSTAALLEAFGGGQ